MADPYDHQCINDGICFNSTVKAQHKDSMTFIEKNLYKLGRPDSCLRGKADCFRMIRTVSENTINVDDYTIPDVYDSSKLY